MLADVNKETVANFVDIAQLSFKTKTPTHLRCLVKKLCEEEKDSIILDHGCGGGLTALFLISNGFRNTFGVDVGTKKTINLLNKIISFEPLNLKEKRFFLYDGVKLPMRTETVNLCYSQQVIEHLTNEDFVAFFEEEQRVLVPGGLALHQVPHRLNPYDSHTSTYFIHWFPRSVQKWLYIWQKKNPEYVLNMLYLRWPWVIKKYATKANFYFSDETIERLQNSINDANFFENYDGNKTLRIFVGKLFKNMIVGGLFLKIASKIAMRDYVLKKGNPQ